MAWLLLALYPLGAEAGLMGGKFVVRILFSRAFLFCFFLLLSLLEYHSCLLLLS